MYTLLYYMYMYTTIYCNNCYNQNKTNTAYQMSILHILLHGHFHKLINSKLQQNNIRWRTNLGYVKTGPKQLQVLPHLTSLVFGVQYG